MNGKQKAAYRTGLRAFRRPVRALVFTCISALFSPALYAQNAGETRFVNNTPFTVHIVAGSGRADVCLLEPHSSGTGRGTLGAAEYFYPVFDVPLTRGFRLRDVRPVDSNFYYQIDDRRSRSSVVIDAAPPLNDNAAYIVLENNSTSGGVSIARTASSRLSRIDAGGSDMVNAGERGVFRINPRENNDVRVVSPVNADFPPVVYRAGWRYVFAFDRARVSLVDTRPLHTIGLPLPAAVVFNDSIPEEERPALAEALGGALAANDAPLRVSSDTRDGAHDDVRYEFGIALTVKKQAGLANRFFFTGDVTIALFRNGEVVTKAEAVVTEFNEAEVYRAARRFIVKETRWYREIAERVFR
ncbi:MAG: hypothetical protein LBB48_10185 [Treponema sp.]|jgi:hypothetical protein|nr:hypothetical protein [Treponema sp.]